MKLTRTIIALLLAGLLLPAAAACDTAGIVPKTSSEGGDRSDPLSTTSATTTVPPVVDPPAGAYFEQEGLQGDDLILRVAYVEGHMGEYTRRSLKADPLDESTLDVMTLKRNHQLKERLGLELQIKLVSSSAVGMEDAISSSLMAGAGEFDILAGCPYYHLEMAAKGYLLNLANLAEHNADYLHLDSPHWAESYNQAINPENAYFWITGDLALSYLGGMYCTFVNKTLYRETVEEQYGSFYKLVRDGKWTVDLMTEMSTACSADDGTILGKPDCDDTFGFGYEQNDMIDALALGMDVQYTYTVPDTGEIILVFNNNRSFSVSEKINALTLQNGSAFGYDEADSANVMQAFVTGKLLFTVNKLFQADFYLNEMKDFAVIPVPKYDGNQEKYITPVYDGCTIFAIPHDTPKVRQAAAALEFLCEYSSRVLKVQYYEQILKAQLVSDAEADDMIDLIHSCATGNFGYAWSRSLDDLGHIYRECGKIENQDIKRKVADWEAQLDDIYERLKIHSGY